MDPSRPAHIDLETIDNHGKLCNLDAINMSGLSLAKRYALITLSGPWISDDYGRFTTSPAALPLLPELNHRESKAALRALEKESFLKTWMIGGKKCWEVAGAYAFKPGLKDDKRERKNMAINLQKEKEKRKKAAAEGTPYVHRRARNFKSPIMIRTRNGNLAPPRKGLYYRSSVPIPKGQRRDKMIVAQPDDPTHCNLRLLPSFNPAVGLTALGAVLRHCLLMEADDYGRVRLDVRLLHEQLGRTITKRGIGLENIKAELVTMDKAGYLKVFEIPRRGRFALIRDSAQHLMKRKRYNTEIPKLMDDREFTHDSDAYRTFFKCCDEHSISRDLVYVNTVTEGGNDQQIYEYVQLAAGRFSDEYERSIAQAPYSQMTPAQYCGLEPRQGIPLHHPTLDTFWHAVRNKLPLQQMLELYLTYRDELDGTEAGHKKTHKILKHLLGMHPRAYIEELARAHNEESLSVYPELSAAIVMHGQKPAGPAVAGNLASGGLDAMGLDLLDAEFVVVEIAWVQIYRIDQVVPLVRPRRLFLQRPGGNVWEIDISNIRDKTLLGSRLRLILFHKTIVAHDARPILKWLQENFSFVPANVRCTRTAASLLAEITGNEVDHPDACLHTYLRTPAATPADSTSDRVVSNCGSKVAEILSLYLVLRIEIAANAQAKAKMLGEVWSLENSVLPAVAAIEANGIHIDRDLVERFAARGDLDAAMLLTLITPETRRLHVAIHLHDGIPYRESLKLERVESVIRGPLRDALSAPAGRRLVTAGCSNIAMPAPHPGSSAAQDMKRALALSQLRLPEGSLLVMKTDDEIFAECPAAAEGRVRTILVECLAEGMKQFFPGGSVKVEKGMS